MNAAAAKEAAAGRWAHILPALGVPSNLLTRKAQACPFCGGKDRFVFDDKHGNGDYFCRGCGAGNGFTLLQRLNGWDFKRALHEVAAILGTVPKPKPKQQAIHWVDVAQLWRTCNQIVTTDPVGAYLRGRGIDLAVWPKALRYVPKWKHAPSQKFLPCMMALFRSADGKLGTVHRTYLGDVTPRRMFLPGGIPKGGAVRLGDQDLYLGVAEGIETALSAALLFRMPVWACCNEGLLRQWQPPEGTKGVTIFGDNDSSHVGQVAAHTLAWRLARDGLRVKVEIPQPPDWDWNDVLKNEIETERYGLPELRMQHRDIQPPSQSLPNP